ncbi:MAG TPA: hypothetical protein VGI67_22290 [Thermoleophilaceae bacterium]
MRIDRTYRGASRAAALTACVAALIVLPSLATAMPPGGISPAAGQQAAGTTPTRLPWGLRTNTQHPTPEIAVPTSAPSAVRVVRNIDTQNGSNSLAIILAALALGTALGGIGYMAFRLRTVPRSS